MAQYKRPTIADREDEYRARRMVQVISPERNDPFADGRSWLVMSLPLVKKSLHVRMMRAQACHLFECVAFSCGCVQSLASLSSGQ